jgi:hypothetical protein
MKTKAAPLIMTQTKRFLRSKGNKRSKFSPFANLLQHSVRTSTWTWLWTIGIRDGNPGPSEAEAHAGISGTYMEMLVSW